eukprot:3066576-Amphidinium_carterae.1
MSDEQSSHLSRLMCIVRLHHQSVGASIYENLTSNADSLVTLYVDYTVRLHMCFTRMQQMWNGVMCWIMVEIRVEAQLVS